MADPFASELVVVPAKGVERWLSQRLSHVLGPSAGADDGVCAGVEFLSPRALMRRILGEDDTWSVPRLTWTVLGVIDSSASEAWCAPLSHHLGYDATDDEAVFRSGRRFATARRLARLFDAYADQRPELLEQWESGVDDVPADLAWQPELWRRVLVASGATSPVARHREWCSRIASGEALNLPERLSLFGHTRLPLAELELLSALAAQRDVHLWLTHPSPALWAALAPTSDAPSVVRSEDRSYAAVQHPLLASLGRDVRELQRSLSLIAGSSHEVPAANTSESLLGALQRDIVANRPPTTGLASDRSLSIHSCHGPARQVEVLREVIVGLLADDPTLEPRDIVVMCPDIDAYAPLIEAAFGLGEVVEGGHPGHRIRVRLADRALVQTNPLLGVLDQVLQIAGGRAEASRVLDLLAMEPVRNKFRFSDDDLEQIGQWVEAGGVRWSFDAAQRAAFGLAEIPQNTWRFGLDRVLAGVALSDDSGVYVGPTLPLDDVGSKAIDLAGRLSEAVSRLEMLCLELSGEHPIDHWLRVLRGGVDGLASATRGEQWQVSQFHVEIAALLTGADEAGQGGATLRLPDVRALLSQQLAGRPTRANFRTGSLTVCTMTPMRSVPHRVVCLLGVDDGQFPRNAAVDGDNVLGVEPRTGERDARSEDRQLLLDAVMAAGDHLVVTYSGHNEVTGAKRPPAVPLGELLDVVRAMAPDFEVSQHPLQAFDPAALSSPHTPSFDRLALDGARAALGQRQLPRNLDALSLPPAHAGEVDLEALIRFFRNPVREFLKVRLGVSLPGSEGDLGDAIPLEVNALQEFSVGDRMLREMLGGRDGTEVLQREWRRGTLPPGQLGWEKAKDVLSKAKPVVEMADGAMAGARADALDIDLEIDGRRVVGTVTDLYDRRVIKVGYQRLGPSKMLEAWLSLLVLEASAPGRGWSAGAIGRGDSRNPVVRDAYFAPGDPRALLADLLAIYDAGMCGPLPLPMKTAHAWAEARRKGASAAFVAAKRKWETDSFPGEQTDPSFIRAWGPNYPVSALLAQVPLAGEAVGPGATEGCRLGVLASRLWLPIFAARNRGGA